MKKAILILTVLVSLFLVSCEKDNETKPKEQPKTTTPPAPVTKYCDVSGMMNSANDFKYHYGQNYHVSINGSTKIVSDISFTKSNNGSDIGFTYLKDLEIGTVIVITFDTLVYNEVPQIGEKFELKITSTADNYNDAVNLVINKSTIGTSNDPLYGTNTIGTTNAYYSFNKSLTYTVH